jgi:hypothetical protein
MMGWHCGGRSDEEMEAVNRRPTLTPSRSILTPCATGFGDSGRAAALAHLVGWTVPTAWPLWLTVNA